MNEPKHVTVQNVIEYHEEKDACDMCELHEWDCPSHPFNPHNGPRAMSAVNNKPYYLGFWHGEPIAVDSDGKARNGQKLPMYARVLAGSIQDAKSKFKQGEIDAWMS